jgi:hypothetical protein
MRRDDIHLRQQRLLIRSAELRYTLRGDLARLQRPAAWADQLTAGIHWVAQHPQWPAGALALWLVLKPRRLINWVGRFWWVWKSTRLWRRWRGTLMAHLHQL